jgi:hypothetical protein
MKSAPEVVAVKSIVHLSAHTATTNDFRHSLTQVLMAFTQRLKFCPRNLYMVPSRQLLGSSLGPCISRTTKCAGPSRHVSRIHTGGPGTPSRKNWGTPVTHPKPQSLSGPHRTPVAGPSRTSREPALSGVTLSRGRAAPESDAQEGGVDFDAPLSEDELAEELPVAPSGPPPSSSRKSAQAFTRARREHLAHQVAMKEAFPNGRVPIVHTHRHYAHITTYLRWSPTRKLSRAAMDGLRALHAHDPETFSTPMLAAKFKISPEAVRRILKVSPSVSLLC